MTELTVATKFVGAAGVVCATKVLELGSDIVDDQPTWFLALALT